MPDLANFTTRALAPTDIVLGRVHTRHVCVVGHRSVLLDVGGVSAIWDGPATHPRAFNPHRRRWVAASERAHTLDDAAAVVIGLVLRFDLEHDAEIEIAAREREARTGKRPDRDEVRELRRRLADPVRVVHALGLAKDSKRGARGVLVRCPWHQEKTPSCSIRVAGDGTLAIKCFACGESSDALGLVAVVRGLHPRRDFRLVLDAARDIAGLPRRAAA